MWAKCIFSKVLRVGGRGYRGVHNMSHKNVEDRVLRCNFYTVWTLNKWTGEYICKIEGSIVEEVAQILTKDMKRKCGMVYTFAFSGSLVTMFKKQTIATQWQAACLGTPGNRLYMNTDTPFSGSSSVAHPSWSVPGGRLYKQFPWALSEHLKTDYTNHQQNNLTFFLRH